ncbi:fumarylacetoacetate (FAA) hydrolase family protein [Halolamina pelagica]|uniref:Fumarylacetoacetate (FAA) hydrolase family protein n=1 Tax=Halolamina pelagica TaxID=699431 RepID=A0A0N8I053_9EURY|nr:fumarylacetoacetate (FAA) hydrolase family protein [Halolamina pelagica]
MRYYRTERNGDAHLLVVARDRAHDLTAVKPRLRSFRDLAAAADVAGARVDSLAADLLDDAPVVEFSIVDLERPVRAEEVWAAGVTYEISEQAREAESGMADVYLDVYDAERPEIFFKATPSRTVGPREAVGVRGTRTGTSPNPNSGWCCTTARSSATRSATT